MAKVPSSDIPALVRQVRRMTAAGAELVRIAVLSAEETRAIPALKKEFPVPVIADIHFNYRLALAALARGADKIRINPGNIAKPGLIQVIKAAAERSVPIRIGLNSGSVKLKGTLVDSMVLAASDMIKFFEDLGFTALVLSLKTPSVAETVACCRRLAGVSDYPFHLGITEAGRGYLAEAKSTLGIGCLLAEGIGDTIRVSLTEPPEKEIRQGRAILQALALRTFEPEIISCPTCGRTQVNLRAIEGDVRRRLAALARKNPSISRLKIAVMGCVVNGPGEAKQADLGIAGGKGKFALFQKGRVIGVYPERTIVSQLIRRIQP